MPSRLRTSQIVLLTAGVVLLALVLWKVGIDKLWALLRTLGAGEISALLVVPGILFQGAYLGGWWLAFSEPSKRPPLGRLVRAFLPGEAMNVLTGLAHMGGEPLKAWLLAEDTDSSTSVATVIASRTLRIVGQLIFVLIGLVAAGAVLTIEPAWRFGMLAGALLVAVGVTLFLVLQQRGLLDRTLTVFRRLGVRAADTYRGRAQEVDQALRASYQHRPSRIVVSIVLQVLGYCAGVIEVYLFLHFLGAEQVSWSKAFLAESLSIALTTVFFFVPAHVGVNEGGRAAVFVLVGFAPELGVASGLLRRFRELVWAAAGLAVYALIGKPKPPPEET